jgi:hypothetical protein
VLADKTKERREKTYPGPKHIIWSPTVHSFPTSSHLTALSSLLVVPAVSWRSVVVPALFLA